MRKQHSPPQGPAQATKPSRHKIQRRRQDERGLQCRTTGRGLPSVRSVQEGLRARQAGNHFHAPARQAIHHPQLPLAAQRGEDGDLKGGGEGEHVARFAGQAHYGYH